jgi:hypothetical protein
MCGSPNSDEATLAPLLLVPQWPERGSIALGSVRRARGGGGFSL